MLTNYSVNNNQPAFGKFCFFRNAKDVLKKKIKTPEDMKRFQELCTKEAQKDRRIDVGCETYIFPNTFYAAFVGKTVCNKLYHQKLFQSPLNFLEKFAQKADKLEAKAKLQEAIDRFIETN